MYQNSLLKYIFHESLKLFYHEFLALIEFQQGATKQDTSDLPGHTISYLVHQRDVDARISDKHVYKVLMTIRLAVLCQQDVMYACTDG